MPDRIELVVFEVSGRRVAIPVGAVARIVRAAAVLPLPNTVPWPTFVDGVVDVHGTLVPVVDVRRRFGLPGREIAPEQHFVLVVVDGRTVALRVDHVLDVVHADAGAVTSAESAIGVVPQVLGIARLANGIVMVQDLAQLLSQEERAALDTTLDKIRGGDRHGLGLGPTVQSDGR